MFCSISRDLGVSTSLSFAPSKNVCSSDVSKEHFGIFIESFREFFSIWITKMYQIQCFLLLIDIEKWVLLSKLNSFYYINYGIKNVRSLSAIQLHVLINIKLLIQKEMSSFFIVLIISGVCFYIRGWWNIKSSQLNYKALPHKF